MRPTIGRDRFPGVGPDLLRLLAGLEIAHGVFKPNAGSFALAECVSGLSGSVLDVGTGTGFVSIVVSQSATTVLATDCSATAVECARRNFRRFGVHAEARISDMFEQVTERFDSIIFNPPVHREESEFDRRLKNGLKRLLPAGFNDLASMLARPVFKHSIRRVIGTFYGEAVRHLNPGGTIFVNTLSADIRWLSELTAGSARLTNIRRSAQFCIVAIAPLRAVRPGAGGEQERRPL